jgi:hypothetical protein
MASESSIQTTGTRSQTCTRYRCLIMKTPFTARPRTAIEVLNMVGECINSNANHSVILLSDTRLGNDYPTKLEQKTTARIQVVGAQLEKWRHELVQQLRHGVCHHIYIGHAFPLVFTTIFCPRIGRGNASQRTSIMDSHQPNIRRRRSRHRARHKSRAYLPSGLKQAASIYYAIPGPRRHVVRVSNLNRSDQASSGLYLRSGYVRDPAATTDSAWPRSYRNGVQNSTARPTIIGGIRAM